MKDIITYCEIKKVLLTLKVLFFLTETNTKHKIVTQTNNTTFSTWGKTAIGKNNNNSILSEAYSEPSQRSKM